MHFKAFSSRIESRVLGIIAVLSLLPIALLAYGSWQQMQRLSIDHFEDRLQAQLKSHSAALGQRFSTVSASMRQAEQADELNHLTLLKKNSLAEPPSMERLSLESKPHLIYYNSHLWIAVPDASNTRIREINQEALLAPLKKLYPAVGFCMGFNGKQSANCQPDETKASAVSVKYPIILRKGFATNFDVWIVASTSNTVATQGTPQFATSMLLTLFLAALIGIAAATLANRRVLAPLDEFKRGTKALLNHDYDVELDIKTEDEFEELGLAFNSMTENLRASNRLTAALQQVDQLILKTTDMERVIRSVLNAIRRIEANPAWLLTFGHETVPAEQLYWVDSEGSLENSDTNDWNAELPLIPSMKDVQPEVMSSISGLQIETTLPVQLDDHIVAVMLIGPPSENVTSSGMQAANLRHYGELTDRLSVAMTHIDRSLTLYKQANQDALTGLLNRQAFERELRQDCLNVQRDKTEGALLFIDLDRFKQVNDTEGHKAGDRLLLVIARRLQQSLRPSDCIARLGGDEFAVILREVPSDSTSAKATLIETCERIISRLSKPVVVERLEHSIHASIGIAHISKESAVADQILSRADIAMYYAKTKAGCNYAFYDPSLNSESEQRIQLESKLRQALKSDDIRLHYQPQLDLKTGAIIGTEGLLRWQSELNGNIPPSLFIPIAEESGIIHDLEPLIFSHAADLLARSAGTDHAVSRVAVNVSVQQIALPGFAKRVFRYIEQTGLKPAQLEIEVTESLFIKEMSMVVEELTELRAAGIVIALDDFGTGYSSLNYLRTLPIDIIKIDRSFIQEIEESTEALELVESILQIARALNKKVVAEGVETHAQLDLLRRLGCDIIQGYLVSRPLPESELNMFMAAHVDADWREDADQKVVNLKSG